MRGKLLAVLAAHRALAAAADDLAVTWASDLPTRNRPNRQKLTADLMAILPKPRLLGDAIYAIADEVMARIVHGIRRRFAG